MTDIIERLRGAGEATVRASAMIAEAKTRRNVDAGDKDALYMGLGFDDTTEAEAIREIETLRREAQSRKDWLWDAKAAEGYDQNTSFDVVWANLRAERDSLREGIRALHKVWWTTGADLDKDAVAQQCLKLFKLLPPKPGP